MTTGGLVDIHAHVLPGVDDGPPDLAAAVELCRAMAGAGVVAVATTSHVSDAYPNRAERLAEARLALHEALVAEGVALDLVPGAEIAIEQVPALRDGELEALWLGGGPWILLEAPLSPSVADVEVPIGRLIEDGHRIVLAHPERCPAFQRAPEQLMRLVARGALCAVTASALDGRFGRTARRFSRRLLVDGAVHALTSDAHDLAGRPPGLTEPVAAAAAEMPGLEENLGWLMRDAPAAILRGEEPGPPPTMVHPPPEAPRKSGWRRLLGG
jgi:protein-tyrosine phosphatase